MIEAASGAKQLKIGDASRMTCERASLSDVTRENPTSVRGRYETMAVATQLKPMDFLTFARASEGLTHCRGIMVSFLALLLGGSFLFLGMYFAGTSAGGIGRVVLFICWLIDAVIAGTGVSATGIMLLDRARLAAARSLSDALIYGFICFLKACVIGLAIFVAALVVALVAAIIYFVCKIPGVGPLLLFFVHPVLVLVAGMLAFLASIFAALAAPALWDGDTVTQAIAKTVAILKERAVTAVLSLLIMGFVTAIILGIISAVILPGYFSMTGLAAGVIGTHLAGGAAMLTNLPFALTYMSSGENGHMLAVLLATVVLVMLGVSTALQVQLMGINLVYLGVSEGVDTEGAQRMLKQQIDQAKARADVVRKRAKAAAQQGRSSTPSMPPAGAASRCPSCNSQTSPEDAFCENCGQKLK